MDKEKEKELILQFVKEAEEIKAELKEKKKNIILLRGSRHRWGQLIISSSQLILTMP